MDENDALFAELRHLHVADVLLRVSERMASFKESNKAAAAKTSGASSGDLSLSSMKKVVESLPQYREQLQKLSLHATVAEELNSAIKLRHLNDLGKLEQELVFGDATSKDVMRILETLRPAGSTRAGALSSEALAGDRLRVVLTYFASHSEKLDGVTGLDKWKAAAGVTPDDMRAVLNLEQLGCAVLKAAVWQSRQACETQTTN